MNLEVSEHLNAHWELNPLHPPIYLDLHSGEEKKSQWVRLQKSPKFSHSNRYTHFYICPYPLIGCVGKCMAPLSEGHSVQWPV